MLQHHNSSDDVNISVRIQNLIDWLQKPEYQTSPTQQQLVRPSYFGSLLAIEPSVQPTAFVAANTQEHAVVKIIDSPRYKFSSGLQKTRGVKRKREKTVRPRKVAIENASKSVIGKFSIFQVEYFFSKLCVKLSVFQ